jgi:hypothetical protein
MSYKDDNPQNAIFELLDDVPYQLWYTLGIGSVAASMILQAMGRKNAADFVGKWPPTFLAVGLFHALVRPGDEDVSRKLRR